MRGARKSRVQSEAALFPVPVQASNPIRVVAELIWGKSDICRQNHFDFGSCMVFNFSERKNVCSERRFEKFSLTPVWCKDAQVCSVSSHGMTRIVFSET